MHMIAHTYTKSERKWKNDFDRISNAVKIKLNSCNSFPHLVISQYILVYKLGQQISIDKILERAKQIAANQMVRSCNLCGRKFVGQRALMYHIRSIHSGERLHECKICNLKFKSACTLKRHHRALHTDVRPYECQECGKKFKEKYHLKNHYRSFHTNNNFKCDFCNKSFKHEISLRKHRDRYHIRYVYLCILTFL